MGPTGQQSIANNPFGNMGFGFSSQTNISPQGIMPQRKTALEQAKSMFDRLVNMKINRAPMPKSQLQNYALAALPGGQMLMSTGKTKTSASSKKINKARLIDQESLAPIGMGGKMAATIGDLLLQIAIPAGQVGAGANKAFTLTNYLNQLLRPKLPTAPGLGAPALLPTSQNVGKFYTPSAIANLPPLVKRVEDSFQSPLSKYGTFLENTDKIQKELAQKFLAQFNRGERGAAYASMGGMGKTPLVSGYENKYAMPASRNAATATVRAQTPLINAATIY